MRRIVCYHYPCPDGIFSALCAHAYFALVQQSVIFVPHRVTEPLQFEFQEGDEVYLCDYSGPDGFALELSKKVKHVIVLDHHKTALEMFEREALPENMQLFLDMEYSGSGISLAYFSRRAAEHLGPLPDVGNLHDDEETERASRVLFQKEDVAKRMCRVIAFVQDRDLWRFALGKESKAFSGGLNTLKLNWNASPWGIERGGDVFGPLLDLNAEHIVRIGLPLIEEEERKVKEALKTAQVIHLGGKGKDRFGKALGVFMDVGSLRSEIGNALAAESKAQGYRSLGVVAYPIGERVKVSLRSVGDVDTTEIAQAYGGGGHMHASSCMLEPEEWELWM